MSTGVSKIRILAVDRPLSLRKSTESSWLSRKAKA